jgi:hypothetical protein
MKNIKNFLAIALLSGASLNAITNTIVIDTPGHYLYGGPMSGDPADDNATMISITSSHVTLDLGGSIFDQLATSTQINYTGVEIQANLNSVTVQNGTIGALKGKAVVVGDGCSEIVFKDLIIADCRDTGVQAHGITGINDISLINCFIDDIEAVTTTTAACVSLTNCTKLRMKVCTLQGFDGAAQNRALGLYCSQVNAIEIVDTNVLQQKGVQFAAGFIFENCGDAILNGCTVYNSTSNGDGTDVAAGFYFDTCQRFWIQRCQSVGNVSTTGFAYGFYSRRSSRAIYDGSYAQLNVGVNEAAGILLDREERSYVITCNIRGNQSMTNNAYGLRITNGDLCYIQNNTVVNTIAARDAFGIIDETSPSNSLIIGNYAFNNGHNYQVIYGGGVMLAVIEGSLSTGTPGLPSGVSGIFDNMSVLP